MKRAFGLAALSCALQGIEAGSFKWNRNADVRDWTPAQETLGVMPLLGMSPMPTEPPSMPDRALEKRSVTDNTCAYVDGNEG